MGTPFPCVPERRFVRSGRLLRIGTAFPRVPPRNDHCFRPQECPPRQIPGYAYADNQSAITYCRRLEVQKSIEVILDASVTNLEGVDERRAGVRGGHDISQEDDNNSGNSE